MENLSEFLTTRRRLVACALVVATAAALAGILRLEFDDTPRHVFRSDDPGHAVLAEVFEEFGADDSTCIVLVEGAGLRKPAGGAFLADLVDRLRAVDGVSRVLGPVGSALAVERLVTEDGATAMVRVEVDDVLQTVAAFGPVVEAAGEAAGAAAAGTPWRTSMTGIPPLRVHIFRSLQAEQARLILLGTAFAFGASWLLLRRWRAAVVCMAGATLGLVWTLGAMGWVGEPMNVINVVLADVIIVIGFTDAVHLVVDVRRSRRAGVPGRRAAADAIRHLGGACLLTSATTAVGFLSLWLTGAEIIQRFGVACAAGAGFTFLAVITVVPLLAGTRWLRDADLGPGGPPRAPRWHRTLIAPLLGRSRTFAVLGTALTALCVALGLRLVPDNRLSETLPTGHESYRALQKVEESFGGVLAATVRVEWPAGMTLASAAVLDALQAAEAVLEAEPLCGTPFSILDAIRAVPVGDLPTRAAVVALSNNPLTRRLVRTDTRRALISAPVPDSGSAESGPATARLEAALAGLESVHAPGFSFDLTGTAVVASRSFDTMIGDLARSLAFASLVIFGVMTGVFRSWRLGLASLVPNIFPLAVTAAALAIGGGRLTLTSALTFTVCLGIAVDDTIHFLARFRRELASDGDVLSAVQRTYQAVGAAIVITTVVLTAGFSAACLSEIPSVVQFGWLAGLAITAALVGDLFLLPALLIALHPRRTRQGLKRPVAGS